MDNWSIIIGIIGACAWIPIIISGLFIFFGKVHCKLLDVDFLNNAIFNSAGKISDVKQRK